MSFITTYIWEITAAIMIAAFVVFWLWFSERYKANQKEREALGTQARARAKYETTHCSYEEPPATFDNPTVVRGALWDPDRPKIRLHGHGWYFPESGSDPSLSPTLIAKSEMRRDCMRSIFKLTFGPEDNGADILPNLTGQLVCRQDAQGRYGLEAKFVPADNGSPRLIMLRSFEAVESATLRYKLWFEPDFDFVKGGKLPGLGPRNPLTGCNDASANRWSVRCMWGKDGSLQIYYYGQNKPDGKCGSSIPAAGGFRFQRGREYQMELSVGLNTPGVADGRVVLKVDGQALAESSDLELRGLDAIDEYSRIQKFVGNWFYGGNDPSWAPKTPQFARFTDFEVLTDQA